MSCIRSPPAVARGPLGGSPAPSPATAAHRAVAAVATGRAARRRALTGRLRGPTLEAPRVRSHYRLINRGAEYMYASESGMKWTSGSAKWRGDRALEAPPLARVAAGAAVPTRPVLRQRRPRLGLA